MRAKLWLGAGILLMVTLVLVSISFMLVKASPSVNLSLQSASLLQEPITLSDFTLVNHHKQYFTQADLRGQWHLLAYGYLNCPDVCPATLLLLNSLMFSLQKDNQFADVQLLFYTIDPDRDSTEKLAEYVAFFGEDIIGLKPVDTEVLAGIAKQFEQELGIRVKISRPEGDEGSYQVGHGLAIYLLDPQGRLHAVFEPSVDPFGNRHFTKDDIYHDYVLIRKNANRFTMQ
ncbi:SCO family protein [Shewanella violacea]|uniref:SCO family protein n=1 Tax=Shewanella violacea TaxID=60217 RepID=UPI0039ED3EE5